MNDRPNSPAEQQRSASRRYSLWVGIAFAVLIGIATVNTLRSSEGGLLGTEEAEAGAPLPEFAVPELLQGEARPARIATAAMRWLDDPAACETLAARFRALHDTLRCDTARVATDAIEKVLAR